MEMGLSTVTYGGLRPLNVKSYKKFIHGDKNLISKDLALLPKDLSLHSYKNLPKVIPTNVRMFEVTHVESSTLV